MAPHPPQPLNFLNVRNQVQTGQVSFITSPGIFPNTQLGRENVPTVNPALGAAISNVKDAAIALGMKSTLIINISSTIFAFVGVILFLCDLNINGYYYQDYWMVLSGRGIAGVLAIFSLLEFSIAGAMAYFAHQGILRCNRSVPVAPAVYVANPLMRESPSAPPIYDNIPDYATTQ